MIKIKTGKDNKFYMSVYATNGNELSHTTKGYNSLDEIMSIIETLKSGDIENGGQCICEIETANIAIKGNAVYFKVYNLSGNAIMVSNAHSANNGSNPRNAWRRANSQALKGYHATINSKYLAKIEIL